MAYDFDYLVIGSGFGGSVSALRLSEKGYRVGVLEMGKRYRAEDFPKINWHLKKFLWAPLLGLTGIFRMNFFQHALVLSGVGVGGGSLVYGNTLLEPPGEVWHDTQWATLKDWRQVMPPFYATAGRMLGATENPYFGQADLILQDAARASGVAQSFYPTRVGVYFGQPGETVPDPYFEGQGPDRSGCILCGNCMVGCRHRAKNTLDLNYLYLAAQKGAQVLAEHRVVDVQPLSGYNDGRAGYRVTAVVGSHPFARHKAQFTTRGVVFAAGVIGTVDLLLRLRDNGSLPHLSRRVGDFVRTNAEAIIGVQLNGRQVDVSDGIAIGSGVYLDPQTHVEAVRYGRGSDAIGLLSTLLTDEQPGVSRIWTWLQTALRHPLLFLRSLNPFGFARSTLILLVMQTTEANIRLRRKRRLGSLFRRRLATEGEPIPAYIPAANRFAARMAKLFKGMPMTALSEIFLNVPTTAHILGGAAMGPDAAHGVIDAENRVFNYKNMYVCDGSMIGANLGVNPSLTITALSEHAMAHVPPAAEQNWAATGQVAAEYTG